MMADNRPLQFAPFSSVLDAGFWYKLTQNKLDVYGLDDKPRKINGFYYNGDPAGLPTTLTVDYNAFNDMPQTPPRCFPAHGILINTNTIDAFKQKDKKQLLDNLGSELWEDIISGRALEDPSLLTRFLMLSFADLKKYHYYYWFAFPALCTPENTTVQKLCQLEQRFNENQISSIQSQIDQIRQQSNIGYFLLKDNGTTLQVGCLSQFQEMVSDGSKILFCVCDPCTLEDHPGWPLRNFLTLIAYHWAGTFQEVEVLCFRDRIKDGIRDSSHSIVLTVKIQSLAALKECPKCVGWEKNAKQKLGPRMVNLSSSMDPAKLAEASVDLNLKLMRWRIVPELDLGKIAQTKCLLLGSGTLGCNISRLLLGWGVRNITLVDNGRISYSNPVRQTLFEFEDSLHGGKMKAKTAAEALKKIFPGVNAVGLNLSIPMPGHAVTGSDIDQTYEDVKTLERLVTDHDLIFLLMDTRESRWLPTMLGAKMGKIVINAALGFDTFLVIRHGVCMLDESMDTESSEPAPLNATIHGSQLGCYFCNDVVAPGDSTKDRTLDQQCTVSRPGISMMASALAVELLVSLLQHPEGPQAPADTSAHDEHLTKDTLSPLGLVPHQIRGFLSRFYQVLPACRRFDKCTACSSKVLEQYEKEGYRFLLQAFNQPSYLEDLSGLTNLHQETLESEVWELSDNEDI